MKSWKYTFFLYLTNFHTAFSETSLTDEIAETELGVNTVLVHLLKIFTEKNGLTQKMETFLVQCLKDDSFALKNIPP